MRLRINEILVVFIVILFFGMTMVSSSNVTSQIGRFNQFENTYKDMNPYTEGGTLFIVGDYADKADVKSRSLSADDYAYIEREKIIEIANGYLTHEWYPTIDNIFHDTYNGWSIDTPDRDTFTDMPPAWGWKSNQKNNGIPYKWGGFSSIAGFNLTNPEDFDEQYTGSGVYEGNIHFGGDIYIDKNYVCPKACGVDCSGFVSRCWDLPMKHGTYTLPSASSQIKFNELECGDVLNIPRYHVILFIEFVDEDKSTIRTIEAGGSYPNVNEHIYTIRTVSNDGFYVTLDGYPLDREFGLYRYDYINNAPSPPTITGPTSGSIKESYTYRLSSLDPENDDIYLCVNWGEGSSEGWLGPYPSGTEVSINHSWMREGSYEIRAKTKDSHDVQSGWSDPYIVSMPKMKMIHPFLRCIETYPNLISLLQQCFQL